MNNMQPPDLSDQQDRIWLSLVANGGREAEKALEALYRKYASRLGRFLRQRGAHPDEVEDLLQETFIRVAKGAAGFKEEALVSTWIHAIARNLLVSHARKLRPEDTMDEEGWRALESHKSESEGSALRAIAEREDNTAQALAAAGLQECYGRGFTAFSRAFPQCADALRAVVEEALSMRELAVRLKRTEAATREYLSQCRKKLKPFLEPCVHFLREG